MSVAITFLRPSAAFDRLGIKRSTGYLRVQQGLLPPPVPIGPPRGGHPSMTAFVESEIDAINAARATGKTDQEIQALVKRLIRERARRAEAALSEAA